MSKMNISKRSTRIALLFFCCLLLLSSFMTVSFARYTQEHETHSEAKGAKFDVTADCVYDGATHAYVLQITNHSEVTVFYTLANGGLPEGVVLTDAEGTLAPGETQSHRIDITEEFLQMHKEIILDTITIEQIIS